MAATYVKLGKKAKGGSFCEANSQVSLYGDKIQKIGEKAKNHKRVARAINAGHIVLVTEDNYKEWAEKNKEAAAKVEETYKSQTGKKNPSNKKKDKEVEVEDEDDEEEEEEGDYMSMNKDPLIEYALTLEGVSENFTEDELNDMNKSEIQAEVADALSEEEED